MRVGLLEASKILNNSGVVAVPTETVYGLAARADDKKAIENVFSIKNRPQDNPLIVHCANFEMALQFVRDLPPHFDALTAAFWPGSLTLIAPVQPSVSTLVTAALPTVAVRVPAHPLMNALLSDVGPLVAPSANLSGTPSSTCPEHVEADFGEEFPVLDGGHCAKGVESTILLFENEWKIVRLGAVSQEQLSQVLGQDVCVEKKVGVCPGSKYRHYAPRGQLCFDDDSADVVIGFSGRDYPKGKKIFYLGSLDHPEEIAARLFDVLRQMDREGIAKAWVDLNFDRIGILKTVYERLIKAAG